MGMAAVLFNGAEPFEKIVSYLSTEGIMWNLVKIAHAVSQKKFKNYTILYMCPGAKAKNRPGDKMLIVTNKLYYFNHTLCFSH